MKSKGMERKKKEELRQLKIKQSMEENYIISGDHSLKSDMWDIVDIQQNEGYYVFFYRNGDPNGVKILNEELKPSDKIKIARFLNIHT